MAHAQLYDHEPKEPMPLGMPIPVEDRKALNR